ncbi:MAG: copper resistance protein CopC [Chloroflexi bacterium]|nr:copper resistance protein CopC [Chloroflexota bacterium]
MNTSSPLTRAARLRMALAAGVVVALLLPGRAWAHANLERADPAPGAQLDQPPRQLQLFFSEAVDNSFSRVQLLNAQRDGVDRGDSHVAPNDPRSLVLSLPDELPNGVYTVAWRTLSAVDGHTVNGAFPLIVGPMPVEGVAAAAGATSQAQFAPATAIGRWWFSLAASALFGTLLSWLIVFRPLFGRSNPAALPLAAARSRQLAIVSAGVLLVGTLWVAIAQASAAADVPIWGVFGQPLFGLLSRGRFAALWWTRLGLVGVALAMVTWQGVRRWRAQVALVATGLALLTSSLNSHAAALLSGAYLGVAADWLHFAGVATWIGGLVSLVYVLPTAVRASQSMGDRVQAQAVARFSCMALIMVGVIVATGTFQAWLEVGSWAGLVATAYGLSITTKIILLAVMLILAAFNLLIARPGLARTARAGSASASTLGRRFALAVRGEVALASVVLLVAAILTGFSPAREELAQQASGEVQSGPVDRQVNANGLFARIQISPAALGINRIAIQLPGADPTQVERVQLTFTYLDAELGSQPVVLPQSATAADTWDTTSPLLSQAGTWQAEMLVRRTGQDDARTALRFLVAGPGGSVPPTATASGAYPLLPSPLVSLSYLLVAMGLGVAGMAGFRALREPRRRRALQRHAALLGAGVVLIVCGGYVNAAEQRNGVPLDVANIRDAVPPDERSLAIGRDVYTTYCETCHGESGHGDGPAGLRLVPRPADLRRHTAPGVHTDGELFYWVSYGFPNSAMPAWKDILTEEQRWSVINYARATFGNASDASAPTTGAAVPSPSPRP